MTWSDAYQKLTPYLFKIIVNDGEGTGFFFMYNKNRHVAGIATAAHVVRQTQEWHRPLRIQHFESGREVFYKLEDRIILIDSKRDVATILVKTDSLPFPNEPLTLAGPAFYKATGLKVGWIGFPNIYHEKPCFFSGHISSFLDKHDCYLIDGIATPGVSGGPVFTCESESVVEIIGVVSGYRYKKEPEPNLGLLQAYDATPFHDHIAYIDGLEDANQSR